MPPTRSAPPHARATFIAAAVFGLIAMIPLVFAMTLFISRLYALLYWPEGEATVITSEVRQEKSSFRLELVVKMRTRQGESIVRPLNEFRGNNYSWVRAKGDHFRIGSVHPARHAPDDVKVVRLNVGWNFDTFGVAALVAFVGSCFGIVAVLAFTSARRQQLSRDEASRMRAYRYEVAIVALFVLFIGAAMIASSVPLFLRASEEKRWPTLEGRSAKHEVFERSSRSTKRTSKHYRGRVTFEYTVGERRLASPIELRISSGTRARMEKKLRERYPLGSLHSLRLNPKNPHDVRFTGRWSYFLPAVFFGTGSVIAAVAIWLLRGKTMRQ